ncbi:hypothetical protein EDEG_02442 [Edhazardia aedis USNM 41457]|uniref:Uncharacterized protein n=1 Tax=Edhazardia aedis (strain USNM 41457) TaxID=1003232 RepID=J9D6P6_EDHAE|nr:hypothetical protein EDEG_02442 [Edhazardia aedis USNM 41457]|eukprot:EJW03189.1 hypothetical protein EDEG_02442 [Edhazardia aedis USNM 41457]
MILKKNNKLIRQFISFVRKLSLIQIFEPLNELFQVNLEKDYSALYISGQSNFNVHLEIIHIEKLRKMEVNILSSILSADLQYITDKKNYKKIPYTKKIKCIYININFIKNVENLFIEALQRHIKIFELYKSYLLELNDIYKELLSKKLNKECNTSDNILIQLLPSLESCFRISMYSSKEISESENSDDGDEMLVCIKNFLELLQKLDNILHEKINIKADWISFRNQQLLDHLNEYLLHFHCYISFLYSINEQYCTKTFKSIYDDESNLIPKPLNGFMR